MMVQSILFDKKLFTPKQAITWLKKHKYKYSKIDIKPNHLRFRQITPKKGDEYRTKKLGDSGIELILEMPKLKGGANNTEPYQALPDKLLSKPKVLPGGFLSLERKA